MCPTSTRARSAGEPPAEGARIEHRAVHLLNRLASAVFGAHRDECKAARAGWLTVENQLHLGDLAELGEGAEERVLGRLEGEVSNVQSVVHLQSRKYQNSAVVRICALGLTFTRRAVSFG